MNVVQKIFNNSQFLIYKNLLTEEEVSALQSDFQKFKKNELGDLLARQKNTRFTFGLLPVVTQRKVSLEGGRNG